jgi:ATP-dependent DNA helicase RecG
VDLKFVNWIYSTPSAGVEITPEPATTLQVLIAAGEGPIIEFKQIVPTEKDGRRKVCRTIAAFASGSGGHVLFGVDDDGQVLGLAAEQVTRKEQDTVAHWIRAIVVPPVEFQMQVLLSEDDKQVLDVEVQKGPLPPYGVEPGNPQYYVRRGATTFPASTDEVRTLARAHPATGQTPTGFNFK